MFLGDEEVCRELNDNEENRDVRRGDIQDIYDGELYKKLKSNKGILNNIENLSVHISWDGASWLDSADKSGWPFQFSLNELPPKLRSKKLILGGLWFGPSKPKSHIVIKSLVEELHILSTEGVTWTDINETVRHSKIVPLCCCVDSPARASMMECKQYNGKYGCPYCYNPGRRMKYPDSEDGRKGGWKYPFSVSDEDAQNNPEDIIRIYDGGIIVEQYRDRTEDKVLNSMIRAAEYQLDPRVKESDKIVKGFSGLTSMSASPFFNVLWGFPPDLLHLLQGIFQRVLFPPWFEEVRSGCYIGSPSTMSTLNKRLTSIKPAKQIHRKPRSLLQRSLWKASEHKSFLLYFGIPCLNGILKPEYLEHFACFVEGISLLMQSRITTDDLEKSETLLEEFIREVERLYGSEK